jgi:hypothetical protein
MGMRVYIGMAMAMVMVLKVANLATSETLVVKGATFLHRNIDKYTWTFYLRRYIQTDHILIDRRRHSSTLDGRSCRGADCDTDHCLVVAKVRERLAAGKDAAQNFYVERFNLKKLSEIDVTKQYQINISNKSAALENVNDSGEIYRVWESIKQNIKISAKESLGLSDRKQQKPCFDEKCLQFLDQRKQAKMQWLRNPNKSNVDNLNNVRSESTRHFRNNKREYLKVKARPNELETNRISETWIQAPMSLRRVTSLKRTQSRMRRMIWLQTPTVIWLGEVTDSLSY